MLMTVEVRSNPRQALAIPEISILDQVDGAYVFKLEAGEQGQIAERVRIETGARSGGMVEVLVGLNAGELVITEGVQGVRPGQTVSVGGAQADRAQQRPRG